MVHADCYVGALDCQGAKRVIPQAWRKFPTFDNIHKLEGVPVITVQLRCELLVCLLPDDGDACICTAVAVCWHDSVCTLLLGNSHRAACSPAALSPLEIADTTAG